MTIQDHKAMKQQGYDLHPSLYNPEAMIYSRLRPDYKRHKIAVDD